MVKDGKWLEPYAKCYIVECVHQRSKHVIQSHAPEEFNHIHNLSDELLVEILCRLPCSKSAIQCMCVCKHWAALISHPYFISQFIACKVGCGFRSAENGSKRSIIIVKERCTSLRANGDYENGGTSRFERMNMEMAKQRQAFAAVIRSSHPYDFLDPCCRSNRSYNFLKETMMMYLEDPLFNPKSFSFSSVPNVEDGNLTRIFVVGVCNDLFLYRRYDDKYDYYIFNVQTKERLVLPSHVFDRSTYFLTGFTCDPYYYCDCGGGNHRTCITLNPAYRYTIVVVPYDKKLATKFRAHVLSSKTGSQWREIVLSLPRRCQLCREEPEPGFGFGGMLRFLCIEGIIGFDPYNCNIDDGVIQCQFISWPPDFRFKLGCVGVCQGYLHISEYSNDGTLSIWVLEDYKRGEWYLQHRIALQEWNTSDSLIATQLTRNSFPGFVLGFHPTNADVIYLNLLSGEFALCNLPMRTLEVVSHADGFHRLIYPHFVLIHIMFPIWPMPLPTLV